MRRQSMVLICCLAVLAGSAFAQTVIVTDFPVGVGGSVNKSMFEPYLKDFKAVADTLHAYPLARAIITGGADGVEYRDGHDAKNPGLALGRAHFLRNLLIAEFGVDSTQVIVQSDDIAIVGGNHRFASVRIDRALSDLAARVNALEQRPPVEKHFTEVKNETSPFDVFGLQFGLGATSSPFGGMPMLSAAVTWERTVFVEGFVGHTFWNGTFNWQGTDLSTKRRQIGAQVIVFPWSNVPLGLVGGWARVEEISLKYYEYTKMSEGPIMGLRFAPFKYLSATGTWNPNKQRLSGKDLSSSDAGQFGIAVAAHYSIGGAK